MSIHPTMSNKEVEFIMDAIESTAANFREWQKDYEYHPDTNEYSLKGIAPDEMDIVNEWYEC